ncbi:MAG: AEC family transporter [Leptolyngbya sp. SIO4C1]|nr:AEC family transporter [Leptolyngbya sp. SIO4C1]
MSVLISAVLPIALIALAGVWAGRAFALDFKTLSQVNIYVLLPALVIVGLRELTLAPGSALGIVAGFVINTAVLYGIAIALGRSLPLTPDERKSLVATTLFANTGNMGLPFVLFALGDAGLTRALVYLVCSSTMVASIAPTVLTGKGLRTGLGVTLKLPVFWAMLSGLSLQFLALSLPLPVDRAIELLSEAAIPTALLTLGIQLARTPLAFGRYELFAASLRLLVSPLMAYSIGRLLGLGGLDLQVLVLQSAMPVAVTSLIWVTEFGGNTIRVARTIVLSTLLSLATLPALLWLTS